MQLLLKFIFSVLNLEKLTVWVAGGKKKSFIDCQVPSSLENCITCPPVSVNQVYLSMNSGTWCAFLAIHVAPTMSVAGVVLCWFEFIALSACASVCAYLCVCGCVYPVRADIEALPFLKWAVENLQVGPSASPIRVFMYERWSCDFLFFIWLERYCLFKVCDLAKSNLTKHTRACMHARTHTHSIFM